MSLSIELFVACHSWFWYTNRGSLETFRSQYENRQSVKEMLENRCEWEINEEAIKKAKEKQQADEIGTFIHFLNKLCVAQWCCVERFSNVLLTQCYSCDGINRLAQLCRCRNHHILRRCSRNEDWRNSEKRSKDYANDFSAATTTTAATKTSASTAITATINSARMNDLLLLLNVIAVTMILIMWYRLLYKYFSLSPNVPFVYLFLCVFLCLLLVRNTDCVKARWRHGHGYGHGYGNRWTAGTFGDAE